MRIAIDISPTKTGHQYRGIGVYTKLLTESLKKYYPQDDIQLVENNSFPQSDIIHYPNFDFFFLTLPLVHKCPAVVTIHDVIPLIYPQAYPPGIRGQIKFLLQRFKLNKIHAVITDSLQSKKDIHQYLNYPLEKIYHVPLAADPALSKPTLTQIQSTLEEYNLQKPYFLYVGDINYNKNLITLLRSFSAYNGPHHLVLVSRALSKDNPVASIYFQTVKELNLENRVHFLANVTNQKSTLSSLYSGADWYIQPSLYEGFGLPIVEAIACQTPIISSHGGSLKEIVEDAALVVNPLSENSFIEQMNKANKMTNSERETWVKKGVHKMSNYSWETTARETYNVYKKVLNI